ncbi:MAG: sigma-70 family RNA polymerase sigma factor [Candidatus Limnocylindrales bacterium]
MEATPETEADLIERARHGDVTAFEALVRAHQEVAFRTAWIAAGGADDAEDAAQEGFMKAFAALPRFRPDAPFRPWLLTIVANEARNRRRSASRRHALALRVPEATATDNVSEPSPEAAILATERRHELLEALQRLGAADREVVAYRYLLELSEAETAAALGIPVGTAKSRLSRALSRLRAVMSTVETRP